MPSGPLAHAHRLLDEAVAALDAATGPGAADAELISALTLCEGLDRRLDRVVVTALADLERRGSFAERGYRSTPTALGDLLGWERFDARRRLVAAEQLRPRIGLDGAPRPPRLTAAAFDTGAASLRHVEVATRVLGSPAADRLSPEVWAGAETQVAAWIPDCTPTELQFRGTQLVDALDTDGPEPDDRPRQAVNELRLTHHPNGAGGRSTGSYDDAAMFDAIATLIDTTAQPSRAPPTTSNPRLRARPKPSPTPAATSSTTARRRRCPTVADGGPTSTWLCAWRTWSTAPARPFSISAARSHPCRCACSAATPRSSRSP